MGWGGSQVSNTPHPIPPPDTSFFSSQLQWIFKRVRQSTDFMLCWQTTVSDFWGSVGPWGFGVCVCVCV